MKNIKRVGTKGVIFLKMENKNTVKTYDHVDYAFQKTLIHISYCKYK